jgi:drug/metabolite transporter (DMT)-like permease
VEDMHSPTPIISSRTLLLTCLLVTWLVWGSSFVAIAWALETMPPLLLMATRFVAAGSIALLIGLLLVRRAGQSLPCRRSWRDASIVGAGLIVVGMGATSWAATRLPSGITALLVATAPLWIVVLQLVATRGASRSVPALAGVGLGTLGVALLVAPGGDGSIDLGAAVVLVLANGVWAAASLYARQAVRPRSVLVGVGMQMVTGGILLGILGVAMGELATFSIVSVGALAGASWTYLVVAASLGGFVAYGWLLEHTSATTASTHAFVNPLVAVALGALLLGEIVDARMLVSAGAIVAAVILLMADRTRVPAATSISSAQPDPRRQRREQRLAVARAARPVAIGRGAGRRLAGWSPAPTPSFAARRAARPAHVTDGMDALAIDEAIDRFG